MLRAPRRAPGPVTGAARWVPFRRETVCRRAGRSLPSPGPGAPQKQRRPYQEGPEPGSEPAPRTPSSPKPTHRLSPRPAKPKPAGAPQGARRGRREGGRRRAGSPGRSAAGAGGCPAPGAERCAAAAPPPPPARPGPARSRHTMSAAAGACLAWDFGGGAGRRLLRQSGSAESVTRVSASPPCGAAHGRGRAQAGSSGQ